MVSAAFVAYMAINQSENEINSSVEKNEQTQTKTIVEQSIEVITFEKEPFWVDKLESLSNLLKVRVLIA